MSCNFVEVDTGDMVGYDLAKCCGDSYWVNLRGVFVIFVETEEIGIRKVRFHA